MTFYVCKRDVWSPSALLDCPEVLVFKKGNIYELQQGQAIDEEGELYPLTKHDEDWFQRHFKPL